MCENWDILELITTGELAQMTLELTVNCGQTLGSAINEAEKKNKRWNIHSIFKNEIEALGLNSIIFFCQKCLKKKNLLKN